jgi:hypothetical protein
VTGSAAASEGLGDGHRAVDELRLRRQQRAPHALPREVAQREQRLQPDDAATGDQHA